MSAIRPPSTTVRRGTLGLHDVEAVIRREALDGLDVGRVGAVALGERLAIDGPRPATRTGRSPNGGAA